jgi:hypothetical protein
MKTPGANGGLSHYERGEYDKEYWKCDTIGAAGNFVRLQDIRNGGVYEVPIARANKALRHLHLPSVAAALSADAGNCRCKRNPPCYQTSLTTSSILRQRHVFFQQLNEAGATAYLAGLVRPWQSMSIAMSSEDKDQGSDHRAQQQFKWVIDRQEVCDDYFRIVFGVSKDKLKGVRALLRGKGTIAAKRVSPERPRIKYNQCKAFWRSFFKNCQRPNDHTRLFPVNESYPSIYEDYFEPWFAKLFPVGTEDGIPCLGWLLTARHDEEFDDVKNRPKHHHCRCQECANLQARRLKAFNSTYEQEQYELEWQDHQNEKRNWRDFEAGKIMSARHNARRELVFWYDDTEALGIPKFTKRPPKNLTTSRLQLIPFLIADLARGRDFYLYTVKGRFRKGANRLCSSLWATFRASKGSTSDARFARFLTLMADNAADNKNNTVLAFCSDLVLRGWFDVIELVFGPPGHTHNGGDQQHQIHNEVLGNFTSPTFVHFLARYAQSWRQPHSRPTPAILDVQYDWDNFYKPYITEIGGHTKTPNDPVSIRGFRIARGPDGIVNVQWKTKAESGDWRGVDGQVGSPGFVMLKSRPRGQPVVVEPKNNIMDNKFYKQLMGSKMMECVEAEGAPEAMAWLAKAAKHGVIPVHKRLQQPGVITPGELGSEVELKCDEVTAVVQLIEADSVTDEEFWSLPAEVERELLEGRRVADALSNKHRLHPAIGYKDVAVRQRPTWEGSAAQAYDRAEKEKKSNSSKEDDSDSDSVPDGAEEASTVINNASRMVSDQIEQSQQSKRARIDVRQEPEEKEVKKHDVLVVFGEQERNEGDKSLAVAELWLGVKLSCKAKGKVRIQFLEKIDGECGMYLLCHGSSQYSVEMVEHTFKDVEFIETTTYKLQANGQRQKTGKDVKTRTSVPLDLAMIDKLSLQCAARAPN